MRHKTIFITCIILVGLSVAGLGVFVSRGCLSSSLAQYWVLGITLVTVLLYAYYTYGALETQRAMHQWIQNPTLGSYIDPELVKKPREDGRIDFKTRFHIENFSPVHAVAKIDINPKLNGKPAKTNDSYSGKRWWYVPAKKRINGNFPLVEILESHRIDLGDFQQEKIRLTLEIKVIFKRWEQQEDKPMLENPPDQWYYDHDKRKWVHEPTTSEIQFPVFSDKE